MSRAAWLNAALAVIALALGAWVYVERSKDAAAVFRLSATKPADARSIRIERAGAAPMTLEKKHGAWFMTSPFAARGDEFAARALLGILEAETPHRLAAIDLARFELAPPRARLTIDGQRFEFGMVSPVAREQYVLSAGSVYAVHPRYGASLPVDAAALASRALFGPGEMPVRFELNSFAVEQRDGKWALVPGNRAPGQDEILRWVEAWRLAGALRVGPYSTVKSAPAIGVRLADGRTIALHLLSREPELVLARPDEKLQYHFRPETAERLLAPPGAARGKRDATQ